jgi:hypothetical protein
LTEWVVNGIVGCPVVTNGDLRGDGHWNIDARKPHRVLHEVSYPRKVKGYRITPAVPDDFVMNLHEWIAFPLVEDLISKSEGTVDDIAHDSLWAVGVSSSVQVMIPSSVELSASTKRCPEDAIISLEFPLRLWPVSLGDFGNGFKVAVLECSTDCNWVGVLFKEPLKVPLSRSFVWSHSIVRPVDGDFGYESLIFRYLAFGFTQDIDSSVPSVNVKSRIT